MPMTGGVAAWSDGIAAAPARPVIRNSRREIIFRFAFRVLFPIHRKGEQYVSRLSAGCVITRIEKDHTTTDGRTRAVDRSAARFDAVDGFVRPFGVVVPQHFAVGCGISTHVA